MMKQTLIVQLYDIIDILLKGDFDRVLIFFFFLM
jgi:hypothetical protein